MFILFDLIICGFVGLSFCCGIVVVFFLFFNKKCFFVICMLYKEKFGFFFVGLIIFDNVDFIGFSLGYVVKINFIVNFLIFGKSLVDSINDDVVFIKDLLFYFKNWFIVEYVFFVLGLVLIVIVGVVLYF